MQEICDVSTLTVGGKIINSELKAGIRLLLLTVIV